MKRAAGMFGFLAVFLFLAAWPVLAQEHETPAAETPGSGGGSTAGAGPASAGGRSPS